MSFAIILYNPDIPQNTGNIIRLCANNGFELHLVEPLGFPLQDKRLRRSGLDYHEYTKLMVHKNWEQCKTYFSNRRIIAVETVNSVRYDEFAYQDGDALLFGSETRGLPQQILDDIGMGRKVRIPMYAGQRSLNLSNSVAIASYEVWRQFNFEYGV